MKQLLSEKSQLIKRTFATNQFIDQLKDHKEVVHIWCSMVPTQALTLVVVHVNDAKKIKKLRKLDPVRQLLDANEAVFVFLDTAALTAHENEGTLFLSVHCTKEKWVYGADDFSYSWYTESQQHEVYRQRHASVMGFINGLIAPEATNFPVGGGHFYGKAVGYHLGVLEQLAIGTAFPTLSLRKRVLQLNSVLPFTKRFFLRDKDRLFLLDRMYANYEEEDYFLDDWWDATVLLLSQLQDAVELVLDHLKALKDRKPLPPLALPEYSANEPELKQLVSVVSQEPRIEEVYLFHTREFLAPGPIKRHYFMIVFVDQEAEVLVSDLAKILVTSIPQAAYYCNFIVISKMAAQRLLFFSQSFYRSKVKDSNCIFKRDLYAASLHWERTIAESKSDLDLYYKRVEHVYLEFELLCNEAKVTHEAISELPKIIMRELLILMLQAYVYKKLSFLNSRCDDLDLFLSLALYSSTDFSIRWHCFNSNVLDLLSFFESESDVLVDVETAGLIQEFYKELHGVIGSAYD